jgi:hypothetical protein
MIHQDGGGTVRITILEETVDVGCGHTVLLEVFIYVVFAFDEWFIFVESEFHDNRTGECAVLCADSNYPTMYDSSSVARNLACEDD